VAGPIGIVGRMLHGATGPDAPAPIFELRDVCVERGGKRVIQHLSADVNDVPVTMVAGVSGAGKTSLLRLLNRLDVPASGTVHYRGADVAAADPLWLRRTVAYVAQRPALFPGSVFANLCEADPDLTPTAAEAACKRVHLPPDVLDQEARSLSGGEAQRLCLARSLLTNPAVVLADEPTAALDTDNRDEVETLVRELAADGVRFVWVTHDRRQLRRLGTDAIVLGDGVLLAAGPIAGLADHDDPRVRILASG
jgi:UDP-glucose/iron transport system ATP-binding protein